MKTKHRILYINNNTNKTNDLICNLNTDFILVNAYSGKEVFDILKNSSIDLIIVDNDLFKISGIELLYKALSLHSIPRIILFTENGENLSYDNKITKIDIFQIISRTWKYNITKHFLNHAINAFILNKENESLKSELKTHKEKSAEKLEEISVLYDEIKMSHDVLQQSEERLKDITYSTADWIWEINTNLKFTFASGIVKQLLGYDPDELIGKTPFDLMKSDDARVLKKVYERIFENKADIKDLYNWTISKKGRKLCFLTSGVPVYDHKKTLRGYRGVSKNVTHEVIAYGKIEENEKKYHSLFQNAPDGLFVLNKKGEITSTNEKALCIFQYNKKEILKLNVYDLFPAESGERKHISTVLKNLNDIHQNLESTISRKDGSLLPVEINLTHIIINDEVLYSLIIKDISDRIKAQKDLLTSEKKFRTTYENAPLGIVISDTKLQISSINQSFCNIIGEPKAKINSHSLYDFIHNNDKAHLKTFLRQQHKKSFECRLLHKNGNTLWANISISTQNNENGTNSFIIIIEDITIKKSTKTALDESKIRLSNIIENVQTGIIVYDNKGVVRECNTKAKNIIGFKSSQIIGHRLDEINLVLVNEKGDILPFEEYPVNKIINSNEALTDYLLGIISHKKSIIEWVLINGVPEFDKNKNLQRVLISFIDITERKKAEEDLKESEARLKEAQEIAHIGSWSFDIQNKILVWSDEVYRIMGLDKNNFDNKLDIFHNNTTHPDERYFVYKTYIDSIDKKTKYDVIHRVVRPKGEIRYVREQGKTTYNNWGKPVRTLGTIQDITEQQLANNKIKDLNEQLEARVKQRTRELADEIQFSDKVINSLPGIFYVFNKSGNLLRWNKAFQTEVGYTNAELKKMNALDTISLKDRDLVAKKIKDVIKKGASSMEAMLLSKKGMTKPFYFTASKLTINKRTYIAGTGFDLSEQKKAQEEISKLSEAVKQSPATVVITDIDGNIEYVNPSFTKLTGYTSEETIGKNPNLLSSGKHSKKYYQHLWETIKSGKIWNGEFINTTKNGDEICESASIAPIFDQNNTITHFIAVKEDITNRKQMEEELKKAKVKADRANQAKSEFLANMSHEIRTPMNSVLGFSDLLATELTSPTQKSYVNSIQSSSKSLLKLINDILDLSKIEAGKFDLQYSYTDIRALVNDMVHIFGYKAKEKGLDFIIEVDENVPNNCNLDEIRLRQIIINLISNAIKFTDNGHVKVKVLAGKFKKGKENCCSLTITTQDTGIGITKKFQEKLFESFTQQDGQSTKKYGGTGLGLSISKKLIELMNGNINVDSSLDKGSTFTINLEKVEYLNETFTAHEVKNIDSGDIHFKGSRILIVDDIENNRKYILGVLKKYNLKIETAMNGKVAIEKAREFKPDLIITDIRMPVMNGYEMLYQIKKIKSMQNIPIVASSASVMKESITKIKKEQFSGILMKPFQISDLIDELTRHIPYSLKRKPKNTEQDNSFSELDKNQKVLLLEKFKNDILPVFNNLIDQQPMDEVDRFASLISETANEFNLEKLAGYGSAIKESAVSFNVEEMLHLINKFQSLYNQLTEETGT